MLALGKVAGLRRSAEVGAGRCGCCTLVLHLPPGDDGRRSGRVRVCDQRVEERAKDSRISRIG